MYLNIQKECIYISKIRPLFKEKVRILGLGIYLHHYSLFFMTHLVQPSPPHHFQHPNPPFFPPPIPPSSNLPFLTLPTFKLTTVNTLKTTSIEIYFQKFFISHRSLLKTYSSIIFLF